MRTILVTGGAGFIGSHLVDRLLKRGDSVVTVDNFDPFYGRAAKERNIRAHLDHPRYTLLEADIREPGVLDAAIDRKIDAVVHLAAKAGVRPSLADPVGYQQVNVTGTQHMLEFARERGIGQFLFASSSSVYGVNRNVPWKEDDHVLKPISPYAGTKVSGELLGHVYSTLYGIRFIALRFFTVYGPRQRPDLAIHKFFRLMAEGEELPIYGEGETRRDYTYVADIVDGMMAGLAYEGSRYEVINLGNSRTVTLSELVRAIEKITGKKAKKAFLPEQPGDVPQTWADISKAERLLGYDPNFDLEQGLRAFYDWFSED